MHETILVVDDEPKIVKLARDYLEQGGFRVFTSADGTTALAIARHERPDLLHMLLAFDFRQLSGTSSQIVRISQ